MLQVPGLSGRYNSPAVEYYFKKSRFAVLGIEFLDEAPPRNNKEMLKQQHLKATDAMNEKLI